MSETTAKYHVQREKNDYTPKTAAQWGLEILKRSVLEVLYEEHVSGNPLKLTRAEISERSDLQMPGGRNIDNVPLIQGILFHLREDKLVENNAINRWWITEKGISIIEGG